MSTPAKSSNGASYRTDKRALLDALAEELKKEKQRSQVAAEKMLRVEAEVEEKHADFLEEEARLEAQHSANASTIACLRKKLARVKQELEAAHHVDEEEAEAYLALLSSQGGEGLETEDDKSATSGEDVGERVFSPEPLTAAQGKGDVLSRSAPLPRRTSNDPPVRPPRRPRPTSLVAGHPFQSTSSYPSGLLGTYPPPDEEHGPEASPTQYDESGFIAHPAHSVHPELAKDGGRWSKVFPSLKRKTSLTKRV